MIDEEEILPPRRMPYAGKPVVTGRPTVPRHEQARRRALSRQMAARLAKMRARKGGGRVE